MIALSLYDFTGVMVQPWARNGHECICVDWQHPKEGRFENGTSFIRLDLNDEASWEGLRETLAGQKVFISAFPVCTDLTLSGARHWEGKRRIDPDFQRKAVLPFFRIETLAKDLKAAYVIENPKGRAEQLFRPHDYSFDPKDYGGYLPADDVHPFYPNVIPPRDAYTKITYIWAGGGFIMPPKRTVSEQFMLYRKGDGSLLKVSKIVAKTGGSSLKTKNIRSATPRGFAEAVYWSNHG